MVSSIYAQAVDERVAANITGLSVRTLQKRRFLRQDPPYVKLGRSVRYRTQDLVNFLEQHRIDPVQGGVAHA